MSTATAERAWIETLDPQARQKLIDDLDDAEKAVLLYDWKRWARPKQLAPAGEWDGWLVLAGRGFGKTRLGCEYIRAEIEANRIGRVALISETAADGRDVLVEGEAGLLAIAPPWFRPTYEASKRRVTWPNGAIATLYDAREPDQLRGPQHDAALLDELAKYRYAQAVFDNLLFGLRLGDHPRWIATTTPRPIDLIKRLARDPCVALTKGSSLENLANLAATYKRNVIDRYAGTRLGRQEIDAEILEDVPGALWSRRNLDEYRVPESPDLERIVVGVDPAATSSENANETGITIAGAAKVGGHAHGYILDDWSMKGTPDEWARRAVAAYRRFEADRIVAESNQGGEMVSAVIRSIDPDVPVTLVHASRGKYVRAEPVSALYEQGRIHHVGMLPTLEDQMIAFTPESAADRKGGLSPDRVDSLVWACTDLFPLITARVIAEEPDDDRFGYSTNSWMAG